MVASTSRAGNSSPSPCGTGIALLRSSRRFLYTRSVRLELPSMKLADLAETLSCRLEGDPAAEVTAVAGMDHATPGHVTFLANRRYFPLLHSTRATAIFIEDGIRIERDAGLPPLAAFRTANPYFAFARAIEFFYQPPHYAPDIHPTAVIASSAKIGANPHIGPYCFVDEGVTLGA